MYLKKLLPVKDMTTTTNDVKLGLYRNMQEATLQNIQSNRSLNNRTHVSDFEIQRRDFLNGHVGRYYLHHNFY